MLKKTAESLVVLLKKLKKLIRIPHSSEVESVFKRINCFLKTLQPDEVADLFTSFFMMITSLGLICTIVLIVLLLGGLL